VRAGEIEGKLVIAGGSLFGVKRKQIEATLLLLTFPPSAVQLAA